jgi:AI-2 transport protein TqsA
VKEVGRLAVPVTERHGVPRAFILVVGIAAALLLVGSLRNLAGLLGPVFFALVLTVAAFPLRQWLERKGVPAWVGGLMCVLVVYLVLIGLTLAFIVSGARFAELLPAYRDEVVQVVQDVVGSLQRLGVTSEQIDSFAANFDLGVLVSFVTGLIGGLTGMLSSLAFVLTLVLFMTFDAAHLPEKARRLAPERAPIVAAFRDFAHSTRRYLVVSTVFGLGVAVIDVLALVWIGVPVALLWGLFAFITNYIPNIGFVLGVIPPAVLGLLEGGWSMMLAVVVAYSVINIVIQSVIQPKVVGDAVGLATTLSMFSVVFWTFTMGAIGAIMALPLTLFFKAVFIDSDPRSAWVGELFSAGPAKGSSEPPTADAASQNSGPSPAPDPAG